jgi:UDP-N-acetylmuramoyl-L-alanyl-D-glutamate--2,6-diaminopimelate ligase
LFARAKYNIGIILRKLVDILKAVKFKEIVGDSNKNILDLTLDSRDVREASIFVAIKGSQTDGHAYVSDVDGIAAAVICEVLPESMKASCTYVLVEDSSKSLGLIASNFYGNPSAQLKLVAVTGTNGKTSVATMLFQLFKQMGYQCGLLSTVENRIGNQLIPSTHTTPHAIAVNSLLARMVENGCSHCFMEASSHAIDQNRIHGLDIDGAIFTNLTHDHLDYHKTFKEYLKAKKSLFDGLSKNAFALSNADDKNAKVMLQNTAAKKLYYALTGNAEFSGRVIESDFNGMMLNMNGQELHVKLIGSFNAYNLLAVYGAALLLGEDETEVLVAMSTIEGAEGRFEYMLSSQERIVGIVDYAHTPDALKKVLETINQLNTQRNQLITVVGCGGDRDKSKRPLMAAIAARLSSKAIYTSDNPRSEDPNIILDEMQDGVGVLDKKKVLVIENRRQAIKTACMMANTEDIILVAGKGHESYQDVKGVKSHFDDKEELEAAFKQLNK